MITGITLQMLNEKYGTTSEATATVIQYLRFCDYATSSQSFRARTCTMGRFAIITSVRHRLGHSHHILINIYVCCLSEMDNRDRRWKEVCACNILLAQYSSKSIFRSTCISIANISSSATVPLTHLSMVIKTSIIFFCVSNTYLLRDASMYKSC